MKEGIAGYLQKGLLAASMAHFWPDAEVNNKWGRIILDPSRNNFKKAKFLWNLIETSFPRSGDILVNYLFKSGDFPINKGSLSQIGIGREHVVFKLKEETTSKEWALKINHHVMFSERDLQSVVNRVQNNYSRIKNLFAPISEVVPEEHFFIFRASNNSFLLNPTMAILQPLISEPIRCLFDFSKEEIKQILHKEPVAKKQLKTFIDIFLSNYDETGEYIDINGHCNLSLIGEPGKIRLLLIDSHGIDTREKIWKQTGSSGKIKQQKVSYRLEMFRQLQKELT